MTLDTIIAKQPIIDTPPARLLAEKPQEYEERFRFHVETHVTVADLADKWDKMLRNLEQKRSVTGLIYADTGYGKTSTAASLWQYAEERGFVAVPPFMWASMTDMLIAAHGWVRFRLKAKRPDLVDEIDSRFNDLMQSGLNDLSSRIARTQDVSFDDARKIVEQLSREGQVSDVISASRLLGFLENAVATLLDAGYKGLLLLPDEFELFETTNSDIAKNFAQLKEFIFPLFQQNNLPLGCVVATYNKTQAQITQRENYMLARFNKPEGSLINLETVYGTTSDGRRFPEALWDKLAAKSKLSKEEQQAITPEVLTALGQFLAHPRSTNLISGPRSVVATFRRAATHYRSKKTPYTIFDFCDDYLNPGMVCYNQQEVETLKAYTSIIGQGVIGDRTIRQEIVKLMCVMPEGVPHQVFETHGIPDEERIAVIQALIGTHVLTKPLGPTLLRYRDSAEGGDQMVELLKVMRDRHNPGGEATMRAAVRAFVNHILPSLLNKRVGAAQTGWAGLSVMDADLEPVWTAKLTGTASEFFPDRTLAVHVGDHLHSTETGQYQYTNLYLRFVLNTERNTTTQCLVSERGLTFVFDVGHYFDAIQVPREIGKLEDVFMPERVTPLLLLDMLDFFDQESSKAKMAELKLDAQVNMLRSRILNQLIQYLFSDETKAGAVAQHPSFDQIPIGRDLVERSLSILTRERYPDYKAVAITHQWINLLVRYCQLLRNEHSLGIRRGVEPMRIVNSEVPGLFNVSSHVTFRNTYYPNGVLRNLLRIDELDEAGEVTAQRIESSNNQKSVALWFTLHPIESDVLESLESSSALRPGGDEKAIRKHDIFSVQEQKGYLSDEVEKLIEVLLARGLVAEDERQGVTYLYLLKTEISVAELLQGVQELEELDAQAREHEFEPEWHAGRQPSVLRQRIDDPDTAQNEIAKDHLRRDIREAKAGLSRNSAQWLLKARNDLLNAESSIAAYKSDPPKLLEQTTGHPTTEFSTLLFQDIRGSILGQFRMYNEKVSRLQNQIKEHLRTELLAYEKEKTPQNAISTAGSLVRRLGQVDSEIRAIQSEQSSITDLHSSFLKWRELARRIEQQRLTLKDLAGDEGVQALLEQLDSEQNSIKRHLADRSQTVAQVLDDYEHFANRIAEIENEFAEVSTNREKKFLQYQADIHELLKLILPTEPMAISYNPRSDAAGYQEVDKQAIAYLGDFCDRAVERLRNVQIELLKPREVFQVEPDIRMAAERLSEDVRQAEQGIHELKYELKKGNVQTDLAQWVDLLEQAREDSRGLLERHNKIMERLRTAREQLTMHAQTLLQEIERADGQDLTELIISLRSSSTSDFESASQIVMYLEELYQRNWINIRVSIGSTK